MVRNLLAGGNHVISAQATPRFNELCRVRESMPGIRQAMDDAIRVTWEMDAADFKELTEPDISVFRKGFTSANSRTMLDSPNVSELMLQ